MRARAEERNRAGDKEREGSWKTNERKEKRAEHQRGNCCSPTSENSRRVFPGNSLLRVRTTGEGGVATSESAIFRCGGHAITRVEDSSRRGAARR